MICLPCRWITARRLDDGAELPRWVTRHHAGCPECRAQHDRDRQLIARLAADARGAVVESPPFLHGRILANLDFNSAPVQHFGPRHPPGWALAVAGIVAVVLVVMLQSGRRPEVAWKGLPDGRFELTGLSGLPGQETVLAIGANLDAPLESELRLVMDDARTALSALSRDFVPSDLAGLRR